VGKGRLEAFSDGVTAIVITIMVLELKVPHGADLAALGGLWPVFLSYVLSFVYVAIYWNNHHHLLHAVHRVGGGVLWANLHLLFWLSLFPFTTHWMGESHFGTLPVAVYGTVLLLAATAYYILVRAIVFTEGSDGAVARAVGRDRKGMVSIVLYVAAIAAAATSPWISCALYVGVALMWLVPDRRFEALFKA
jgi:uncharacterized membrane protein